MKTFYKALIKSVTSQPLNKALLFTMAMMFSSLVPATSYAGIAGEDWGQLQAAGGQSQSKFVNLYKAVKGFAGILLLIGCVLSAIFFMMGKTSIAVMVFGGGVILYGGAYLIGIASSAFGV